MKTVSIEQHLTAWRDGVIQVPDDVAEDMAGGNYKSLYDYIRANFQTVRWTEWDIQETTDNIEWTDLYA